MREHDAIVRQEHEAEPEGHRGGEWPSWVGYVTGAVARSCEDYRVVTAVMLAAFGAFALETVSFFLHPTAPPSYRNAYMEWLNAALVATGDRVQSGGGFYVPDADGSTVFEHVSDLVVPYFPGTLVVSAACSALVPSLWAYWPRILGTVASIFLYVGVWRAARGIGASPFAASGVTVTAAALMGVPTFWQPFHPDPVIGMAGLAFGSVLANLFAGRSPKRDRAPARLLLVLGVLAAVAVFFKQTGIAVGGGGIMASLVVAGVPLRQRLICVGVICSGMAIGALGALSFPGAWGVCVVGMAEPLFPARFYATHVLSHAMAVTVPSLIPGFVLLLTRAGANQGRQGASGDGPSAALVMVLLAMTAFQLLSSAKIGGGPWNLDLVTLIWLPVSAWALERILSSMVLRALVLLALVCGTADALSGTIRNIEASRAQRHTFPVVRDALASTYPGALAYVQTGEYLVTRAAGLDIVNGKRLGSPREERGTSVVVVEGLGGDGSFAARVQGQSVAPTGTSEKSDWEGPGVRVFELPNGRGEPSGSFHSLPRP